MIRLRHKLFLHALRLADQLVLVGSLAALLDIFGRLYRTGDLAYLLGNYYGADELLGLAFLLLAWALLFHLLVDYHTNRLKSLKRQVFDLTKANSAAALLLLVIGALFGFKRIHIDLVASFWVITNFVGFTGRALLRFSLRQVRRSGYNYRHILIVGHNETARALARRIQSLPELGYKIHGYVADTETSPPDLAGSDPEELPILGQLSEIRQIIESRSVDEIMICLSSEREPVKIWNLIQDAYDIGIVARLFPTPAAARILTRCSFEEFEGRCVVTFFREHLLLQLLLKKSLDLFGSLFGLLLLSPLFLLVALAIKLTSPGPVFFSQIRVGMNKRTFRLLKFRSMYVDAERRRQELMHLNEMDGPVFKIKNDPRITPIGRLLRKTSIDELPQLINVLFGKMSLVGPRPPLPSEVDQYEWLFRKRLSIKPGITCLWQISGRNEVSFQQWMEMDRHYVENWSIWLDLRILLKTIPAVLLQKGSS